MRNNVLSQSKLYDELYSSEYISTLYDRHMEETFFKISDNYYFLPNLFKICLKDRIILDIGCGGGNVGTKIIDKAEYIVNLDISFNALLHARKKFGFKKSRYINGDVIVLPFREGSFDIVVGYCTLHHIEDIDAAAKEISRVLKKDGLFLCFEPAQRYNWFEFWSDLLKIPYPITSFLKKIYLILQKKFAKRDNSVKIFKDLNLKETERHFLKTPSQYRSAFKKSDLTDIKVRTILLEFIPPRFLSINNRRFVKFIFKLSDLFHKLGIAKEKGKFIIIEARKI
ncbi:MAG: class I SAM-dependent methyltransferase [Candidatus Omnitrophica bacterium]|nr:class I SAM-dependent methyltransferase [Candidatus Omnitrophota bacterium]